MKPEHKGGVENDIRFIKNNFWPYFVEKQKQKGRPFRYRPIWKKLLRTGIVKRRMSG
jgi:hypothetical protein